MLTELCELARKYGTDKSGFHLKTGGDSCHNYGPVYHKLLNHKRQSVKKVLEIGTAYGCSLAMWREYFPNAHIYGIDFNPNAQFNEERVTTFVADQSDRYSLDKVLSQIDDPEFDLIVDDGSHHLTHQVFSANHLLPRLSHDGLYVIEDITFDCQPQTVGDHIRKDGFMWWSEPCGIGLGNARCWSDCPHCRGAEGETLICIARR